VGRSVSEPTFFAKSRLARYVDEVNRLSGNRPAVAAFLDPPSNDLSSDHLSVNSLEVESVKKIAAYHRWKWQSDRGHVALCLHQVVEYTDAGRKCGINIIYDKHSSKWRFLSTTGSKMEEAYKHRPVMAYNNPFGSPSHCGVEFKRVLKEHTAAQFARRLSGKRFHLVDPDPGKKIPASSKRRR
jgi:hypothetical protein